MRLRALAHIHSCLNDLLLLTPRSLRDSLLKPKEALRLEVLVIS
jgi:hypothetical protein